MIGVFECSGDLVDEWELDEFKNLFFLDQVPFEIMTNDDLLLDAL
jgi:hypothetical protein